MFNSGILIQEFQKIKYKRNKKMLEMRKNGYSFQDIADTFGVSKQRVHQVIRLMEGGDSK